MKAFISKTVERTVKFLQALSFIVVGPKTVSRGDRREIVRRIRAAHRDNPGRSASTFGEQIYLVRAILNLPADRPGAIAEFGCFKGMSTVAISIAAKHVSRRVLVFDSFEGLPADSEAVHQLVSGTQVDYKKGDYAGTLDEVKDLVTHYGEIGQVEFVRGYFCDTLPKRPADEKYALIFEDADLISSVRDILLYAWPRLSREGIFFCHEALDLEVAGLFFDKNYWQQTHGQKAPGLAGAGMGLPIDWGRWGNREIFGRVGSCLAATFKR
jgi:predicted O-methyltransferase YrrM